MAVTHHATIRNTLANAVLTAIDQDALAGSLVFQTAALAEVATLTLNAPPAGSITGAVLTFNTITDDTNATGGTTTNFKITDNSGDEILYGSVGATGSGEDIELSSTTINNGDTVSVTALTYTAPL